MSASIPQGIEVLVKKASVDAEFKTALLARRAGAAEEINLELTPSETALLRTVPAAQLEAIISQTFVPVEHRRAFLGRAAGAMLAALGVIGSVKAADAPNPAVRVAGVMATPPPAKPANSGTPEEIEQRIIDVVGKEFNGKKMTRETAFVKDLAATPEKLASLQKALETTFQVKIPDEDFKKLETLGQVVERVQADLKKKQADNPNPGAVSRGLRPDVPPVIIGVRVQ
jgi:acyl carrier protein